MSQDVSVLHDTHTPVVDDGAFKRHLQSTTRGHQYLKFIDGRITADGIPEPAGKEYLCLKIEQVGRMFHKDGGPPDTCEPWQVDEMNSRIPKKDWPFDLNNNQTEPFKPFEDVFLADLRDGSSFIFSNSTTGMRIAAEKLVSQVQNMRRIRGANVFPVVTIESVLMKTKFGSKARPSFNVVRWVGDEGSSLKAVKEPTASEIVNDSIPEHPTPKTRKSKLEPKVTGAWDPSAPWETKPKPVEASAPWDDGIPNDL
jgi:hypothetical protein